MNNIFPDPWDWDDIDIPDISRRAWEEACGHYIARNYLQLWENPDEDWRRLLAERYVALCTAYNGGGLESPLEQKLMGWMVWLDGEYFGLVEPCHEPWFEEGYTFSRIGTPREDGGDEFGFSFMPQVRVAGYRVDFMILVRHKGGIRRLAVECDGHDFHEKTKEQAQRDKKRDRDLLLAGIQTIRFTGSELFREPAACFEDIQEQVGKMVWEVVQP